MLNYMYPNGQTDELFDSQLGGIGNVKPDPDLLLNTNDDPTFGGLDVDLLNISGQTNDLNTLKTTPDYTQLLQQQLQQRQKQQQQQLILQQLAQQVQQQKQVQNVVQQPKPQATAATTATAQLSLQQLQQVG